jgi:uncharacterized protein (DUF1501 family)
MATAIGCAGAAFAQAEPDSDPLRFRVKPSGFEAPANENQERQERLLRRMERSDHMVRSICTHCGDEWKHQIYAPFHPLASLGRKESDEEAPE